VYCPSLDESVDHSVLARPIPETQFVDTSTDGWHGARQWHGEKETSIQPREGVGEISTHLVRECLELAATRRDDDDHALVSHIRDIPSSPGWRSAVREGLTPHRGDALHGMMMLRKPS
jgi:hypothetical protein